ncbi:acyl-CoA thioesterase [Anaerosolibacter sp.]|jgi:acyl-CoA thioester hydrolase|uniref:acyl-CoA thioesterase n=1 Tax=Anaerosolibacter sp. TaxID=1872527 RepID=UPI0026166961|nr:thioesterase family protein [Anaerosolibacter sp.]MDF2546344.1 acyl-CoA thioesterase [Anaerosolibacter sp.]
MYTNDAWLRVRYEETDQMGVVYNGNYYTWFEVGRSEFFRSLGYTYAQMEREGMILPVIESGCVYKIPAKYDDEILIRTRIEALKGIRLEFQYEIIRKEDGELLATGKTIHAFVDRSLKPVNFKKVNPKVWEILQDCMKEVQ